MHNAQVELQGKCRRLFYLKIDGPVPTDDNGTPLPDEQPKAGQIVGVASGGGALEALTGNDLIIATFNDPSAPDRIGCIEEFYNPIAAGKPRWIDLTKVSECNIAVDNHRAAEQAKAEFVFEKGITLLGSEPSTTRAFRHSLQVEELHSRQPERTSDHDAIVQALAELDSLSKNCADCCDQLLITRDAAIMFS